LREDIAVFRRLARPLLGLAFLSSGVEALRDIDARAERARGYGVGQPVTASRAVAGTQIGAGLLLALGKLPRLSALVLAVTVVPEAATGHAFWAEKGEAKSEKRSLFARDLGLLGGLLVAAVDTGGRESVPHRARRASRNARTTARKAARKQAKAASKQVQRIS
jgi:putative oxidoreductase